ASRELPRATSACRARRALLWSNGKETGPMRALGYLTILGFLVGGCATAAPSAPAPAPTQASAPSAPVASSAAAPVAAPTTPPAPASVRYGIAATSLNFIAARMAVEQ